MLHDALTSLRGQLHAALRGGDPLELARVAGLLHRAAPDDPALIEAHDALTGATMELHAAAHGALARLEAADEDDDEEQTWGALCALDELLAAATFVGEAASLRDVAEDAARLIRAFPEPWRPHAETATALLRDEPPPDGDPAWTLWAAVEASRWELPLDDAGMPAQTRFALGFWVSLGDWGGQNPVKLAASGALRAEPPWTVIQRGEGWSIALTRDDDGAPAVVCSDGAATATVNGVTVAARGAYGGAIFAAQAGSWVVTHDGVTSTFELSP
ncbi:MAG: hypothetical protein RIT28_3911 [Pseudomonadota bacterium]